MVPTTTPIPSTEYTTTYVGPTKTKPDNIEELDVSLDPSRKEEREQRNIEEGLKEEIEGLNIANVMTVGVIRVNVIRLILRKLNYQEKKQ